MAEVISRIIELMPAVTRDLKQDDLIGYAPVGDADHPVTGNRDLLVPEQVGRLWIVTPRAFPEVPGHSSKSGR